MIYLGIDTSNSPLTVALVKDGITLIEETSNLKVNHSLTAMPVIEELLKRASLTPDELTHIAVAEGPGSYTGVRIGMTIAKTLAWTLDIPLVPVSSLKVLAANGEKFAGIICSVIDARRGTVFAGLYKGTDLQPVAEERHQELADLLAELQELDEPVLFTGPDIALHEEAIQTVLNGQAHFIELDRRLPRASVLIRLARQEAAVAAHEAVPEYRRLAEAEAKYLQAQKGSANE
ncbi:tRNA (adenosine(37)-N6)-threonylcarbamoyltransferase complex dimerization subunit type 1 TsaB [Planococcus lenghuensis]|uniref:tRNA (Adenosine(37)-N6)-threonylcarbamoyltransferase complex dimerization subunit type 1 TsaB n=1 Tax=Planococcus lenghuensis TaxID=2213202 RepID=A0A1Q2KVL7_9BACL|nr:tRNA (adenosine(37)-N6)-threonylcarbamoyltransferase complex dimerization subunit type 1 TsaB [Planococcus lenghuensis]AQQ52154.1 tRNA (adenosine(37)-N6)-threonylcarbamoyltransferase complex dimerization subunit type 1 TsaB [Planococcus lenghuensis]